MGISDAILFGTGIKFSFDYRETLINSKRCKV